MEHSLEKKIVVVGGGFGGVRAALDLAKKNLVNTKIILISDKPHFEYHASLYRVVTGHSPLEVCIPLAEIFKGKNVEVAQDSITQVDLEEKKLTGDSGSHYIYDYLILALGSETAFFDIPGMRELSFSFKSITDALRLKRHIHEMFSSCTIADDREKGCALRFVIIGGGASGTELACELAFYTKQLAYKHMLDRRLISIDLIDANDHLLKFLPPKISERVAREVERLGVTIHLSKRVVKKEIETVYLKDMEMKTKTVIWTAGVVSNHLYRETKELVLDEKGRMVVDANLQPLASSRPTERSEEVEGSLASETVEGDSSTTLGSARNDSVRDVFVVGDGAATQFSGMAQTAVDQGAYVADVIGKKLQGKTLAPYIPKKPFYAIPIGENWGVFFTDSVHFYGLVGWWLRKLADLRFFLSILPFSKALAAFRSDTILWESCPICSKDYSLSS